MWMSQAQTENIDLRKLQVTHIAQTLAIWRSMMLQMAQILIDLKSYINADSSSTSQSGEVTGYKDSSDTCNLEKYDVADDSDTFHSGEVQLCRWLRHLLIWRSAVVQMAQTLADLEKCGSCSSTNTEYYF